LIKQSWRSGPARNIQAPKPTLIQRQYGAEMGITAISQNSFVRRFEIRLFSQNAAGENE
jgi:hypothetical protein